MTELVEFRNPDIGLEVSVAVLSSSEKRRDAVIVGARQGQADQGGCELVARAGIWRLSVPTAGGAVTFVPQTQSIELGVGSDTRALGFDDDEAIAELEGRLQEDAVFHSAIGGLLAALAQAAPAIEKDHEIRLLAGGKSKKKPDQEFGPVGVDVVDFVDCMKLCERNVEWYEVWMHAYCLVKCAIENARGG